MYIDNITNNNLTVNPFLLEAVFGNSSRITSKDLEPSIVLNAQSEQGCLTSSKLLDTKNTPHTPNGTLQPGATKPVVLRPGCVVPNQGDLITLSNYYLPQVWADFLNNPLWSWSWYGHFTFEDRDHVTHLETADKAWMKYIHILNREIFGHYYWKHSDKGVIWARGTEYQNRHSPHYHAIIGCVPGDIRRMKYKEIWHDTCGIARVYAYERGRGAEYYMSKSTYAWKRGEIDLGGPLKDRLEYEQRSFGT